MYLIQFKKIILSLFCCNKSYLKGQYCLFSVGSVNQGLFPFKALCRVREAESPADRQWFSFSHRLFHTIRAYPKQNQTSLLNILQILVLVFKASLAVSYLVAVARGWCLELARLWMQRVQMDACARACPWVEHHQHGMFLHHTADCILKQKRGAIK